MPQPRRRNVTRKSAPKEHPVPVSANTPQATQTAEAPLSVPEPLPVPETPPEGDPGPSTAVVQAEPEGVTEEERAGTRYHAYYNRILNSEKVVKPDGRILFPYEPLNIVGVPDATGENVVLTEDVYRMVVPFRSTRPVFMKIGFKGDVLTRAKVLTKEQYDAVISQLEKDLELDK